MRRPFRSLSIAVLSCALVAPLALADPPERAGRGGGPPGAQPGGKGGGDGSLLIEASIRFGDARRLAEAAGATGYKPLPPGIRKNLARGKPLPPGIAKDRAPGTMLRDLPRHEGYEWRVAGTDLLLVQLGTSIVADVLVDVFD